MNQNIIDFSTKSNGEFYESFKEKKTSNIDDIQTKIDNLYSTYKNLINENETIKIFEKIEQNPLFYINSNINIEKELSELLIEKNNLLKEKDSKSIISNTLSLSELFSNYKLYKNFLISEKITETIKLIKLLIERKKYIFDKLNENFIGANDSRNYYHNYYINNTKKNLIEELDSKIDLDSNKYYKIDISEDNTNPQSIYMYKFINYLIPCVNIQIPNNYINKCKPEICIRNTIYRDKNFSYKFIGMNNTFETFIKYFKEYLFLEFLEYSKYLTLQRYAGSTDVEILKFIIKNIFFEYDTKQNDIINSLEDIDKIFEIFIKTERKNNMKYNFLLGTTKYSEHLLVDKNNLNNNKTNVEELNELNIIKEYLILNNNILYEYTREKIMGKIGINNFALLDKFNII